VKISYVPWWLALGAIGFAMVVSLVAGLYPAARGAPQSRRSASLRVTLHLSVRFLSGDLASDEPSV